MNILIDVRLLGRGGLSGVEEYTRHAVTHLLGIGGGTRFQLFSNGFRKNPLPREWTERNNVAVIDWNVPNRLLHVSSRFLREPAIDRFVRTDAVFSPHFDILRVRNAPHFITFHDLSFIHHPGFFKVRDRFWHWLHDYQRQAHGAASIIADSEFTKSDIVDLLNMAEEKVSVIYPGVNPEFKKLRAGDSALAEFKRAHGINFPFVLFLGTLEPRKNIPAVIRAFTLLKANPRFRDIRLIIAGRPGWRSQRIFREGRSSPYARHIIFWGPVASQDRIFLYNGAEAFVYPSFFEGFGFPPLEAQACGTPVIVADRASLPEIIGATGLAVDPWRVHDLHDALAEILPSGRLRAKLAADGIQNAARFNWELSAKRMFQLFTDAQ